MGSENFHAQSALWEVSKLRRQGVSEKVLQRATGGKETQNDHGIDSGVKASCGSSHLTNINTRSVKERYQRLHLGRSSAAPPRPGRHGLGGGRVMSDRCVRRRSLVYRGVGRARGAASAWREVSPCSQARGGTARRLLSPALLAATDAGRGGAGGMALQRVVLRWALTALNLCEARSHALLVGGQFCGRLARRRSLTRRRRLA